MDCVYCGLERAPVAVPSLLPPPVQSEAKAMPPQLDALGILAQAGSKEFVEDVVVDLFRLRDAAGFPESRCAELCDVLSVGRLEVDLMFAAGKFVVRECVYGGVSCHAHAPGSPSDCYCGTPDGSCPPSCL